MRTPLVAFVTVVALLTSAVAGPRKIIVLPLDGSASATQKTQLNDAVGKVAKSKLDGDVTLGDTTFAETAAAVGCDPAQPACAETVRTTLGVDELVYGSANSENGSTTVTVHRASAGVPPTAQAAVVSDGDSADKLEPALEPAFGGSAPASSPLAPPSERPHPAHNFFDTRERKLGFGLGAGGVVALVIGFSFWASESDLQDQIDNHPSRTLSEIEDLKNLEDRAGSKALWGNIMVGLGLGLAGAGAYYLYKDHKNRTTTITPAPAESGTGMTLVLGGHW
jgi:hypothetical protein